MGLLDGVLGDSLNDIQKNMREFSKSKEIEGYKLLIADPYDFNIKSSELVKDGWIPIGKLHLREFNGLQFIKEFVKYKSDTK